jgi:hypothetical protein
MAETKRTLLKRIDRNVQTLLALHPASLRLRFGTPVTRDNLQGTTMPPTPTTSTLKDNQTVPVTLEVDDFANNPIANAVFTVPPGWQSSDPTIATVAASDDGLSAVVSTVGPLGQAQITVTGTAVDGRTITGIGQVNIVTSGAATFKLNFGTPVDKA